MPKLDDTGTVDLSGLPLSGNRPSAIPGGVRGLRRRPVGEVTLDLTWTGEALEECGVAIVDDEEPRSLRSPASTGITSASAMLELIEPAALPSTPTTTATVTIPSTTATTSPLAVLGVSEPSALSSTPTATPAVVKPTLTG